MTTTNPAAPPDQRRLIRSIMTVMFGFLLTKGVSLLQTIIIAGRFGAGSDYDTFAAGNILPDYLVRLIGGGALGVAFIPVFSGLLNRDDNDGAWRLASQVFNTLLLVVTGLSLVVAIFARPLVENVVASGLSASETTQTVEIMRILCISTILFSLSGFLSGILHGHNHFFLPVLAPIFQDVGLLIGVILFLKPFGIFGLAYGVLLGAVMHLGIQVPGLLMYRARWMPILGWRDPLLRRVFKLMLPRVLIGATFLINLLAITNASSKLGTGAISAFSWGIRFIDIPQALLGTAIGIVIFPTLSALSAMNRTEERLAAFSGAMRFILVATIPAAAGLVLVSKDALRILFDADETARIFTVIAVMSLAIVFQSLHEILTRAFYSEQDTLRPLIFAVIATLVSLLLIFGMYQYYTANAEVVGFKLNVPENGIFGKYSLQVIKDPPISSIWAVGGPALGYVATFALECLLLGYYLQKRWGDIALPELTRITLKTLAATAVMVGAVLLVDALLVNMGFDSYSKPHIIIRILADVVVGGVAFIAAALLVGIQEVRDLPKLIFRRNLPAS